MTTPHLRKQGTATQLVVNEEPFLILGGELRNSSSSSLAYMEPIWQRMLDLNVNTVLTPVSWMQFEPEEGRFETDLLDGLIDGARQHGLRLILLWFGSWKNGMSSYVPEWVKRDYQRFPRVRICDGRPVEILSALSDANREADAAAFGTLMAHVRKVDSDDHTVIMVQVENEACLLPDSRDRCTEAESAFEAAVPERLTAYLVENQDVLLPYVREAWEASSCRASGSWQELFGGGIQTDEIFMAWHYATYIDRVAAAGRSKHDIPMFVNAMLQEAPEPGQHFYPCGSPLPQVMDIWLAAIDKIDLLAPDIYTPNFEEWCERCTRRHNPLFIPEMTPREAGARQVFYAIGRHDAIGTSPFAIDMIEDPAAAALSKSYEVLKQVAPTILAHQGRERTTGFLLDKDHPTASVELGGYVLNISLDEIFIFRAEIGYGLIIQTGTDEFVAAGSGFRVAFHPTESDSRYAGILKVEEGSFADGGWKPDRRLNGDETSQGSHWRFDDKALSIQRCTVYTYE